MQHGKFLSIRRPHHTSGCCQGSELREEDRRRDLGIKDIGKETHKEWSGQHYLILQRSQIEWGQT